MTEESGPCFQLTGTGNDNVVQVRQCVHCVYTGGYMCTKFNVPVMHAWCGTTLTNLFNSCCDCTGIERFLTAGI
jgi:hypothetical protein